MSRAIICPACHKLKPMHPDDVMAGFKRRIVFLRLTCSPVCDRCDRPINAGEQAVAVTYWNEHREGEPRIWEHEYGKV